MNTELKDDLMFEEVEANELMEMVGLLLEH